MASVDRIEVTQNGSTKTFDPASWKALTLPERVGLLKDAVFYAGATEVPAREAVAQLR